MEFYLNSSKLFSELKIKSIRFNNRVVLSPMCQYKATNGLVTDWHYQHYSRFAFSGLGGAFMEATAVSKEGRITHGCTGIWSDNQIGGLKKIAEVFKEHKCAIGIQLAHAGRKASCLRPWDGATSILKSEGPEKLWPIFAPSPIAINEKSKVPIKLEKKDIDRIKNDFVSAAIRANKAGFDMLEIHGAHGYLLHSFFSPLTNFREDEYGGSIENRMKFPLEVVEAVREAWPDGKPLFYRISSTDGQSGGVNIEDTIILAKMLKQLGVDVIDCSSGGISGSSTLAKSKIIPGFQVPYAHKLKKCVSIKTMAVGAIIDALQAEKIISQKRADLVALGRELLADTQWVYKAASTLTPENAKNYLPKSYSFYLSRRDRLLDRKAKPV